jgi:hypothetical protein
MGIWKKEGGEEACCKKRTLRQSYPQGRKEGYDEASLC